MEEIKPGFYKHFKGHIYEVLVIAKHSESLEELVIYRNVETHEIWARPISMWNDIVIRDGNEYKRFTYLGVKL